MRTLHPVLAVVAMIALPLVIATDRGPSRVDAYPSAPPALQRDTRVIRLKHAHASTMCEEIKFALSGEPVGPAGPLVVAFDSATNSLMVSGGTDSLRKAQFLLEQIDVPHETGRSARLIRLRYADANNLASLLEHVIREQASGLPVPTVPAVSRDARTNTLIVVSDRREFESISKIVEALDVPF